MASLHNYRIETGHERPMENDREVTLEKAYVEDGGHLHEEDGLMRVNIYAEETTNRIEIIEKTTPDGTFTGLRFYLELPATAPDGQQFQGPFMHRPGDDDSAAVTFWGKRDMRDNFRKALELLDAHYEEVSLRHPPLVEHDDALSCGCAGHVGPVDNERAIRDKEFDQPHRGHGPDVA